MDLGFVAHCSHFSMNEQFFYSLRLIFEISRLKFYLGLDGKFVCLDLLREPFNRYVIAIFASKHVCFIRQLY